MLKKIILCSILSVFSILTLVSAEKVMPKINSPSVILMGSDGQILYEENADEKLQPASVTKLMTMLLIIEDIDNDIIKLTDMVTASAYASSMGGTQIYLKEGEQMSVEDMLKSIVVASANDAAVAMGEHLSGSEEGFVKRMNDRALELGMNNTTFVNANGLDMPGQKTLTTARDIGKLSVEILKHPRIKDYTTIWMDNIRGGEFTLANTNKMLKTYNGMTGLKTGYISDAGYCISASAKQNDMELIAVVMAANTKEDRISDVKNMLNFGFANYTQINPADGQEIPPVNVILGSEDSILAEIQNPGGVIVEKDSISSIQKQINIMDNVRAPVEKGQKLGELSVKISDDRIYKYNLVSSIGVEALGFIDVFKNILAVALMK